MSDARRYAVWPEPRSRSRSLKGSRPSIPHGTNFSYLFCVFPHFVVCLDLMVTTSASDWLERLVSGMTYADGDVKSYSLTPQCLNLTLPCHPYYSFSTNGLAPVKIRLQQNLMIFIWRVVKQMPSSCVNEYMVSNVAHCSAAGIQPA